MFKQLSFQVSVVKLVEIDVFQTCPAANSAGICVSNLVFLGVTPLPSSWSVTENCRGAHKECKLRDKQFRILGQISGDLVGRSDKTPGRFQAIETWATRQANI